MTRNDGDRSWNERLAHAKSLAADKKFDAARSELQALLAERSNDSDVVFGLAKVSMYLDLRADGEAYFERYHHLVLAKDGYKPGQMLLVLARLCRERGDFKAARKWLDQVDPAETEAHFLAQIQRSMLLAMEQDHAGALALVDSLKPTTPTEMFQVVLCKGDFLRQAGRFQEAFDVLADGVPRVAQEPELINLYASVANQIGRHDVSESAARTAIAIAPADYRAYNNLSMWFAERNVRLEEASQLVFRAFEIAPDNPNVLDTMGYVQYRLGNFGAAEAQLRRSYSLRPHPVVALHLVEVLLQNGEQEEARTLLDEARAKAEASGPTTDVVRKQIDRLLRHFQDRNSGKD